MHNLLESVTERQLSRLMLAALRQARRRAETEEQAHETLATAATMVHEVLDSREARRQDRVWCALMAD